VEQYVFHAKISKGSGKKLCIYIPKDIEKKIKHLHGEEVIVVVIRPDA
jgi:hypothetical protein